MSDQLTRRQFVGRLSVGATGLCAAAGRAATSTAGAASGGKGPGVRTKHRYERRVGEVEQRLITAMEGMEVIDAHTHLAPEKRRLASEVDVIRAFGSQMDKSLASAGMSPGDFSRIRNAELPLDERWKLLEPYMHIVRHVSMARPMFIAMKEFYGYDDINAKTYAAITEKMQEANKPGFYKQVMQDKCRIRWHLTMNDVGLNIYDPNPMRSVADLNYLAAIRTWKDVETRAGFTGDKVNSLDDYIHVVRKIMKGWKDSCQVVGIKRLFTPVSGQPDPGQAKSLFRKMRSTPIPGGANPLYDFVAHRMFDISAELDLVVAVHTGVYGDFVGDLNPVKDDSDGRRTSADAFRPVSPRYAVHPRDQLHRLQLPERLAESLLGPRCLFGTDAENDG